MNPYENQDFENDREFFNTILSAVLASLFFLFLYKATCHFFIKNYWVVSSMMTTILFGILFLNIYRTEIQKTKKKQGWYFYLFFLYSIPVFSFYFFPATIDFLLPSITDKKSISIKATIQDIYYIKHADNPHIVFDLQENDFLDKLDIPLSKKTTQNIKVGAIVNVYVTISKICLNYKGYEKLEGYE
ncbi:hypothetical protein [Sulfurimonas sp.]|uniref:hypothetical protein n=1 Tax=Sulfurimonas sp. TaxID=2022749 RepID=UPI003D1379D5